MSDVTVGDLEAAIRNVPDFPEPGIQFKDITPVLGDARLFAGAIDLLVDKHKDAGIDACVGIDARGFIFAAAAVSLLKKIGAEIVEIGFLIELGFLNGREKMNGAPINSLITY